MRLAADVTFAEGRYRLERRLGAGGMASVWLAVDERLGRRVAIKVVADTLGDDEHWLARFKREARAAAGLSHPGIVQVFDYGVEDGRPYLVMEYISGSNLAERIAGPAGPLPDAARLARELLDALVHVHAAGIVHRDIKPANILLDGEGRAHLTDFGIAQADDATSLTQTGMLIGTMKYLAPEVTAGQQASALSDLYSTGMVLHEVAGQAPPRALATLIAALTAPDPAQRPRSAAAALELLDALTSPDGGDAPAATGATEETQAQPASADATLVQPAQRGAPARDARPAPASSGSRTFAITPALTAGATLAVLAVILIVALTGGGGSADSNAGDTVPSPARPTAPLDQQLEALELIVDDAAQQPRR